MLGSSTALVDLHHCSHSHNLKPLFFPCPSYHAGEGYRYLTGRVVISVPDKPFAIWKYAMLTQPSFSASCDATMHSDSHNAHTLSPFSSQGRSYLRFIIPWISKSQNYVNPAITDSSFTEISVPIIYTIPAIPYLSPYHVHVHFLIIY